MASDLGFDFHNLLGHKFLYILIPKTIARIDHLFSSEIHLRSYFFNLKKLLVDSLMGWFPNNVLDSKLNLIKL